MKVLSVGHQTAGLCPSLRLKHSGQPLLYREVDDFLSLLKGDSILQDEERVGALLGNRDKSRLKVLRALHLMRLKRYSQHPSRTLRLFPSECECGVARIPENRSSRQPGHYFLECLQAFCACFRSQLRASREIAAWVRKTGDQAGVQRIDSVRVHDRDGRSRFLDGKGRRRCNHDDDVDIESNHLCCKLLESLGAAVRITALNDEVSTLLVPELTQAVEQCVIKLLVSVRDKPHPPNSARLLRARRERQCRRRAAEKRDELAPFHAEHGDFLPSRFKRVPPVVTDAASSAPIILAVSSVLV